MVLLFSIINASVITAAGGLVVCVVAISLEQNDALMAGYCH